MIKWIVITLIVITGFMAVMLGLGYLLNENEKTTTVLKQQLEQEALQAQAKQEKKSQRNTAAKHVTITYEDEIAALENSRRASRSIETLTLFKQTLIDNLTCVNDTQCIVHPVIFANAKCHVAVNKIGAISLAKIVTETEFIPGCAMAKINHQAVCQQNICTLATSTN